MNDAADRTLPAPTAPIDVPSDLGVSGFFRRRLFALLAGLEGCELALVEDGRRRVFGRTRPGEEPIRVTVQVHDAEMYRVIALNGSVGVGEAYMDGLWDASDLTALVRVFVRNRDLLDRMERGPARLGTTLLKAFHLLRRNTRRGSRRNIAAHYDLGNALFENFLDPSMTYSSAIFARADESLEAAQRRKLDRVCRKLALQPGDRVVEIGTGWGSFAIHAAREYGCHVTTTTISAGQHAMATTRVREAGLEDRITLLRRDYRDLDGSYDKLVSIEMVEAVGAANLAGYLRRCAALLRADGMALIQAITLEDRRYRQALRNVDFIQRHVFPGSFIPSIGALTGALASTDLRLFHLEDIGPSYALTLRHWRERFHSARERVLALGYPERFLRLWTFYLCYCEGGFLERSIGDVQMLLVKPDCRRAAFLPDLGDPA